MSTVVIAGAGPAGLMLAYELRLAGVEAVVLDPHEQQRLEAPAAAINQCTVELFDQRGLLEPLLEGTLSLPAAHFALLPLNMAAFARPHKDSALILQSRVEEFLAARAAGLGADIRRGHELVGLAQDADGVTVTVRAGGAESTIRAAYLVGCDGRDSTVRELAGIAFPGAERPFHGLVGDVEIDAADLLPQQIGAHYGPNGGHYTGAPLAPGLMRVITAEFETEPPGDDVPVSVEELRESVKGLTGADLKCGAARWLVRYGNPTRNAETYRSGRVFLAGDAAHIHFPLNGQGMNNCIHDAMNLGWKLAAAVRGTAPEGLLDSYHAERHPVGAATCANVAAQLALSYPPEPIAPLREFFQEMIKLESVNEWLIETVTGLGVRYSLSYPGRPFDGDSHPLLGRRLPSVEVRSGGTGVPAARLVEKGRGVLLDLTGGTARLGDLSGWADRIDLVSADPDPRIPAGALLLRPDGHVAWADDEGKDDEGLRLALSAWFGEPS